MRAAILAVIMFIQGCSPTEDLNGQIVTASNNKLYELQHRTGDMYVLREIKPAEQYKLFDLPPPAAGK